MSREANRPSEKSLDAMAKFLWCFIKGCQSLGKSDAEILYVANTANIKKLLALAKVIS